MAPCGARSPAFLRAVLGRCRALGLGLDLGVCSAFGSRMLRLMRLRSRSISSTRTLTGCPTRTRSRGSRTNSLANSEIWTNPSWPTPMSTKAPKLDWRSEEHTSELQSRGHLVCRLLLEKKNTKKKHKTPQINH